MANTPTLPHQGAPSLASIRQMRNTMICMIEWRRARHVDQKSLNMATSDTESQYLQLLAYMQALRDVTKNLTDPTKVVWPIKPSFITEY
jgi:hypothetical protein